MPGQRSGRRSVLVVLAAGLLVVAVAGAPSPARACGACVCPADFVLAEAGNVNRELPMNGPIVLVTPDGQAPDVGLADADGNPLEVTVEAVDGTPAFLVWPTPALELGELLTLAVGARTADVIVLEAAGPPSLGPLRATTGTDGLGLCGTALAAAVEVPEREDVGPVFVASVAQGATRATGLASVRPLGGFDVFVYFDSNDVPSGCFGGLALDAPAIDPTAPVELTLRGIGLDGTLTEPVSTTVSPFRLSSGGCTNEDDGPFGCAVGVRAPAGAPGGLAALALALVALAFQARRGRPPGRDRPGAPRRLPGQLRDDA